MSWFFATNSSINNLFLRVGLGALMLPHGLQKTMGLFGGYGFLKTMDGLAEAVHTHFSLMPMIICKFLAILVILAESVGAIGLIFGFFTRLAAFGIFMVMSGAIFMVHRSEGFFKYDHHLLIMLVCLVLMFGGGGLASIDRALSQKKTPPA